jgi:hypothetical protein
VAQRDSETYCRHSKGYLVRRPGSRFSVIALTIATAFATLTWPQVAAEAAITPTIKVVRGNRNCGL